MYYISLLFVTMAIASSSADRCGLADFMELLKGPQGAPGAIGPPGVADMAAIEQRIREMVDQSRKELMILGEMCYMGMKSRHIPDTSITASSFWAGKHEPYLARLDNQRRADSIGAWVAKRNRIGEWLQIDLGEEKEVAGIVTQGRPRDYQQWVITFKVSCGADSGHLSVIRSNGIEKVFTGNTDLNTKIYNRFPEVLRCRYVRIYPQSWNTYMTMRVELVSGACFKYML